MKAMILAAGLGQRMRPLTDHLPKPMLLVGGKPLLQYHLEALSNSGIREVVINLAYLGEKIQAFAGDGSRFGLSITYSIEPEPLETAGAIRHALPLLGEQPFLLINGDVWTQYPLQNLHHLSNGVKGHLVLVPNPEFHPNGDFSVNDRGIIVANAALPKFTFAGLSLITPELVSHYPNARLKFPLSEVLHHAIERQYISAEIYLGPWCDVGTPARLHDLDRQLSSAT